MKWYIYRPNSLFALEDEIIKKNLERYVKILNKETLPKFILAKHFEVEFNENKDKEGLLELHDYYLEEFMKFVKEFDNEKFELKKPKKSFLDLKIILANKIIESCELCEWKCKINRKENKGVCRVGYEPKIASMFMHLGEESWITSSFTIFFAGCNFKCVYCQNWDISQYPENGKYYNEKELAREIDFSFEEGARNVNFVGGEPTPNLHYILRVLKFVEKPIPVVWNSNAYESEIGIRLLAGIVDIYLYDIKYGNNDCALKYSKIPKYFETATRNIKFAEKCGELSLRHLVLPNHIECCSKKIFEWVSKNLNKYVLNIMDQYRPEYKAMEYEEINRRLKPSEYLQALKLAKELNIIIKE